MQKITTITQLVTEILMICFLSALWAEPGMHNHTQLKWQDQSIIFVDV